MLRCLVAALFACLAVTEAAAQREYPNRPIRLVVPYPPGGTADAMARLLGQELSVRWSQPVVIDNAPGANTVIGADRVARSAPDGYTLLFATSSTLTINPHTQRQLPYDAVKDFAPVAVIGFQDFALVAHPTLPFKTLSQFVAYAKAHPNEINYGSFGIGSEPHIIMEELKQLTGIAATHVPSKGVAQMLNDLLTKTVQVSFFGVSGAGLIKGGQVQGLAITSPERSPLFGDVPTFAELGLPEMHGRVWWGIVAPASTPAEIVNKLNVSLNAITGNVEFQKRRMDPQGLEPSNGSPQDFVKLIKDDSALWGKVVERAGIRLE